jgi:hypothetical protein
MFRGLCGVVSVGVWLAGAGCQDSGGRGADAATPAVDDSVTMALVEPAAAAAPNPQAAGEQATASGVASLSAAQIGMIDPRMRTLIEERDRLERDLAQLRVTGVLDENPKARQVREGLAGAERRIEAYAAEWKDAQSKLAGERQSTERARLAEAFPGNVDLYLDVAGLQARRPTLARVRLVGEVDVGGRRMLRFIGGPGGASESWLIDPARILAATVNR